jgi:hypothetical protein
MEWLKRLLGLSTTSEHNPGSSSVRRITVKNPLIIQSPRLGFLNLIGSSARSIIEEDKAAFRPLFVSVEENDSNPPLCDVLFIYAVVESDGRIQGSSDGLREIIRKSTAPIVLVGSENAGKHYIAACKRTGYGQANLVLTISRKGAIFTQFFTELFNKMFEGKSMPLAWVELAPQIPGAAHGNCPDSIFAAEVSHIVFKRGQVPTP